MNPFLVKLDENLGNAHLQLLRGSGYDVDTVLGERLSGSTKPMIRRLTWMVVTLLAACTAASRPPVATAPQSAPATVPAAATSTGPAAPEQKAPECSVIQAANEREGLAAEGKWLHDHYPGWKKVGQSLGAGADGKSFDRVDIVDSSGEKHSVCFDITSFFGKW